MAERLIQRDRSVIVAADVERYRQLFEELLGTGHFTLYAPGFITQKGEISEFAEVAGKRWHAIVGSAIYKAIDFTEATERMTKQIRSGT